MVVVSLKRTEKLLCALAGGCWLLTTAYVNACADAGRWLAESNYELHRDGDAGWPLAASRLWVGAARTHRRGRAEGGARPFGGEVYVLATDVQPDIQTLTRILIAGGATVLSAGAPLRRIAHLTAAVVPEHAMGTSSTHLLSRQAAACGVPEAAGGRGHPGRAAFQDMLITGGHW